MNIVHVEWDQVFAGSFSSMLGWLEYNARQTAGLLAADVNEISIGAQQVINTIKELYNYQIKRQLLKEWL